MQVRRALKPDGFFWLRWAGRRHTEPSCGRALHWPKQRLRAGCRRMWRRSVMCVSWGRCCSGRALLCRSPTLTRVTVRYSSVFSRMHDLRGMGATNVLIERRRQPLRRTTSLRVAQLYAERFADPDGKLRATFDIVWLSDGCHIPRSNNRCARAQRGLARRCIGRGRAADGDKAGR